MSKVLVRFVHVSDTHIELEEGVAERIAESIARESARTELPEYVRAYIFSVLEEQRAGIYPYPSALQAGQALVSAINDLSVSVDFVLHTGDIAHRGTQAEYDLVRDVFSALEVPIYYVNGNHDEVANLYPGLLEREPSNEPYDHTFEVNDVRFICVDSATNGVGTDWRLSDDQVAWLESEVMASDDRPIVVGIHHPPYQIFHEAKDYFMLKNADAVHTVLKKAIPKVRGVFSGHVHFAMNRLIDGVLYGIAPKPFSLTPGFSVVTVLDDGILVDHHRF